MTSTNTVLPYNGPFLCGFNVFTKRLMNNFPEQISDDDDDDDVQTQNDRRPKAER